MSCNLPCVAFNCYGMKEIITHKKNGYLAKPYSAEDFIKGIEYSLKRQKTLSQESRKYVVNNFKNAKINIKYYKYFKKIKFLK
jgi:glycosyltransferase involved in cell wall biosynthesis